MSLILLILIPYTSAILSWKSKDIYSRWIAVTAVFTTLLISLINWLTLNEKVKFICPWIPQFNINIYLSMDGLSLTMVSLVGIIGTIAVFCSWNESRKNLFYANILWIIGSIIGIFLATDMLLFFFFWEIMSIPMYLIIYFWGYEGKGKSTSKLHRSATVFFLYTQASGLLLLIATISLVLVHYNVTHNLTFDYIELSKTSMSYRTEFFLMLTFFAAFSIKMPLVPLHKWVVNTHFYTPNSGAADLVGLVIKTAPYAILRFLLVFFPHTITFFSSVAMCLGLVNIFYGAYMVFNQNDIKKLIAYSSICHAGFILISIYTSNLISYQGLVIQIVASSLSTTGLILIASQLYKKLDSRNINEISNIWGQIRWLPATTIFFFLATLGVPGTGNFLGEFLILLGCYQTHPIFSYIATFSLITVTIYAVSAINKTCFGISNKRLISSSGKYLELSLCEGTLIFSLVFFIIALGIFPQIILETTEGPIFNILTSIEHL